MKDSPPQGLKDNAFIVNRRKEMRRQTGVSFNILSGLAIEHGTDRKAGGKGLYNIDQNLILCSFQSDTGRNS